MVRKLHPAARGYDQQRRLEALVLLNELRDLSLLWCLHWDADWSEPYHSQGGVFQSVSGFRQFDTRPQSLLALQAARQQEQGSDRRSDLDPCSQNNIPMERFT